MLEVLEAERKVRQEWLEGTEADGWKVLGELVLVHGCGLDILLSQIEIRSS